MALGMGCPWKGTCQYKGDSYHKKNYCNSDSGCKACPHRPMNDGNKKVQTNYNNRRSAHSQVSFGWWILIVVFGIPLVLKLLTALGIF